ncbi:MAG: chemotaxis protein CheD [Phenylobacterium sp.]|nr:chemotaxis protein CheD [Phenylobacterium sp.]
MTARSHASAIAAAGDERRIHLVEGEFHMSDDPAVMITTTLGSCVATCLRDPAAGIGGMNHFLLPGGDDLTGPEAVRYGAYAMEVLINGLLSAGARRERLRAKLFGGGRLIQGLSNIGDQNVTFAEAFLARERIPVCGGSVRGDHARRIRFWPVSGRTTQLSLTSDGNIFAQELKAPRTLRPEQGAVELFS